VQTAGEGPEREGLTRLDELLHGVELRDREPNRDEGILEAPTKRLRRGEHGDEGTLVGARKLGAARVGLGKRLIHTLKYIDVI
jgi:hypothetical protein